MDAGTRPAAVGGKFLIKGIRPPRCVRVGCAMMPIPCSNGAWATSPARRIVEGNLYETKQRPDQKIDTTVALMMAIGRAMIEDEQGKNFDDFLSEQLSV
jgi:hypothetical protein